MRATSWPLFKSCAPDPNLVWVEIGVGAWANINIGDTAYETRLSVQQLRVLPGLAKNHLRLVLTALQEAGLYAKLEKCKFFVEETTFLGLIVGAHRIRMNPKKIELPPSIGSKCSASR